MSHHLVAAARGATCVLASTVCVPRAAALHTSSWALTGDAPGSSGGAAGSEGAAPGRHAGRDEDVKFGGGADASPSSGELYGREDRDPVPSPNPGITQGKAADMSFPQVRGHGADWDVVRVRNLANMMLCITWDEPSPGGSSAPGDGSSGAARVAKQEGIKDPQAYPIQNDPSVPEGAGPEVSRELAQDLAQDESSGPKAAGQGVVEDLAKQDPERYGSGRSSPA